MAAEAAEHAAERQAQYLKHSAWTKSRDTIETCLKVVTTNVSPKLIKLAYDVIEQHLLALQVE
jgi:hypothetical protein